MTNIGFYGNQFLRNLILATLTKKAAEIKVHKKSSPEKEIRIPFAVKKFNLEMTNIRVSWKLIFAQLNFCDFNKQSGRN